MIRTACGDITGPNLGRTDYHEHLFQVSPLLPGDELDDEDRSGAEAALLRGAGIDAMVDATPIGLGRNPEAVARISSGVGLAVVLTTGVHREAHYPDEHWLRTRTEAELAGQFARELTQALPHADGPQNARAALTPDGRPVRAGMLKAGIGYWSISPFEHRVLAAVATAHRQTNAPVMIHLEHGSAAHQVLDLLATLGVEPHRVVLAHVDRNPDSSHLVELAARGAYLGFDGMARTREWPDSTLLTCITEIVAAGSAASIVLGGDVARRSRYIAYGGMPGLAYLPKYFLPRLDQLIGTDQLQTLLVSNPARLLSWQQTGAL